MWLENCIISKKTIFARGTIMDERVARLRTHQRNIDRYQDMLKTRLTAIEQQFVERRLSEERFAIAMVQFMSPPETPQGDISLSGTPE
jgi:hypothetical protein